MFEIFERVPPIYNPKLQNCKRAKISTVEKDKRV